MNLPSSAWDHWDDNFSYTCVRIVSTKRQMNLNDQLHASVHQAAPHCQLSKAWHQLHRHRHFRAWSVRLRTVDNDNLLSCRKCRVRLWRWRSNAVNEVDRLCSFINNLPPSHWVDNTSWQYKITESTYSVIQQKRGQRTFLTTREAAWYIISVVSVCLSVRRWLSKALTTFY